MRPRRFARHGVRRHSTGLLDAIGAGDGVLTPSAIVAAWWEGADTTRAEAARSFAPVAGVVPDVVLLLFTADASTMPAAPSCRRQGDVAAGTADLDPLAAGAGGWSPRRPVRRGRRRDREASTRSSTTWASWAPSSAVRWSRPTERSTPSRAVRSPP
jgi:hypothetical protein